MADFSIGVPRAVAAARGTVRHNMKGTSDMSTVPSAESAPIHELGEALARAKRDPRGQVLLLPGESLYEARPADRVYPASEDGCGHRVVCDLYEFDGENLGDRRYFREFDDDTIDLAFAHLVGDWTYHAIPNMLTVGDGFVMVGRGVFVCVALDGENLVFAPRPIAEVI